MRRGWDTQTVHAVEIRSETWRASCASGRGEIRERKGVRSTRQACGGRVTKRRKKEREGEMRGGSGTGNDGAG